MPILKLKYIHQCGSIIIVVVMNQYNDRLYCTGSCALNRKKCRNALVACVCVDIMTQGKLP